MINFHTIGDSHASEVTWGKVSVPGLNIVCHHLGPMTCASFGMTRPMIEVGEDDWICFCFGEIDCRDHIGKHKENYKEVIDKIVRNYFYAIGQYRCARKFVFSVVPANIQSSAAGNPWPCTGTDDERREYVRYFNQRLKEHCNSEIFLDVHDKYADDNGYFNLKYRDHCIHIIDPVFINEFLCQH